METIYTNDIALIPEPSIAATQIANGISTEQVGENLQISTLDINLSEEQIMSSQGPATFCIAIFLDGAGELSIESGKVLKIEPGLTVVFHSATVVKGRTLFAANSHIHCLDLRFSLDFLSSFGVADLHKIIPMFEHDYSVAAVTMLAKPTSLKIKALANEILNCEMTGIARSLFLQSRSLEALAYILSTFEYQKTGVRFSKQDYQKVRHAVALLDHEYDRPWTIALLAKEVGLNQSKLKQGFHHTVQSTVHNYLEEVRLSAAQHMLEQGIKVIDTSMATGYANPSHFAKRFKQRYSVKPSDWGKKHG